MPPEPAKDRISAGRGQVVLGSAARGSVEPASEHVASLYRLSDPALSNLGLEPLLNALLARITAILEADTAAILLLDEDAGELVARAAKGLEEEVERGVRIPLGAGFAGRIASERVPISILDVAHADVVNPILLERGVRSLLGVPMIVEGELIGVLHVGTLNPRKFATADAAVLELAAARAAPAIERARLLSALESEHRAAVALQRSLLPDRLPELLDVEVAARYLPARDEVGGDWYDVVVLPQGRIGLTIGDVAGHGVRAAALMGQLRTALRAYALEGHSPAAVLGLLADLLRATNEHGMATAVYAVVDPETGELTYASAGHPPPLVLRDGEATLLSTATAPPLGTLNYTEYPEVTVPLSPGATLLLYTDGLVEVRGESLDRGLERLVRAAAGSADPVALCERAVRALSPAAGRADDVALLALHNAPLPEELNLRLPAFSYTLASMRRVLRRWLSAAGATPEDITAITLACTEAAANAVEHAYGPDAALYQLTARVEDGEAVVGVHDRGHWREARGGQRGRGLGIIAAAMDDVEVDPTGTGTRVLMRKRLGGTGP